MSLVAAKEVVTTVPLPTVAGGGRGQLRAALPPLQQASLYPTIPGSPLPAGHRLYWQSGTGTGAADVMLQERDSLSILTCASKITLTQPPFSMHSCNISRRRLAAEPEGDSGLSAVRGWRSYQSLACSW